MRRNPKIYRIMDKIVIDTRELYDYARKRGYEPLLDSRFTMSINLRVSIQRELFGTGHTPEENERFYRWVWAHKRHICEETMRPLRSYSATYVSHILTKGAHPAMAHDPRNTNILCYEMHNKWEFGKREDMRIFRSNQIVIEQLKKEYERGFGRVSP